MKYCSNLRNSKVSTVLVHCKFLRLKRFNLLCSIKRFNQSNLNGSRTFSSDDLVDQKPAEPSRNEEDNPCDPGEDFSISKIHAVNFNPLSICEAGKVQLVHEFGCAD